VPDPTAIMDKLSAVFPEVVDGQQQVTVDYHLIADPTPRQWTGPYAPDLAGDDLLAAIEGDCGETFT